MSDGKVNPLPKCARCGRTLPRPLKPLSPAVTICPCDEGESAFDEPQSGSPAAQGVGRHWG